MAFVASCGGTTQVIQTKTTEDPLAGTYVIKGGGGAIDNVKALTTAFSKLHPTIVWQGFDDTGSDAGVKLTGENQGDLGYISPDLKDPGKGPVMPLAMRPSGPRR